MPPTRALELSEAERAELESRQRSRAGRSDDARRARVLLMLADGCTYREICASVGCSPEYLSRWRRRFEEQRLGGLYARHPGRRPTKRTVQLEAKILERTRRKPRDGSTNWSVRKLAKELGIPHMTVARVWARAGIKPHRLERYTVSNDPEFESKAADIIGLYLNPPQHAVVFCVDEK
ncbi:MAG TPA: IS630 family transposase, partial [Candidatus Krumholzibacteria bacterium]